MASIFVETAMHWSRPTWEPDSNATSCGQCRITFSFDVRRHHCRHCGRIFCHYCSSKSRALTALGYNEPVRLCDRCFDTTTRRDNFMEAVRMGDLKAVESMLQQKLVDADDTNGMQTPLLVAASRGHEEMMRLLLDFGANVHAIPNWHIAGRRGGLGLGGEAARGDSPLHYAVMRGSVASVLLLLRLKADVNRPSSRYGETPLHKAVLFGQAEMVHVLLAAGAGWTLGNDRGLSAGTLTRLLADPDVAAAAQSHSAAADAALRQEKAGRGALLWEVLVALHLYKRPPRARAALAQALMAAHAAGCSVHLYIPQLCDLALHEPAGEGFVRAGLLRLAAASCGMAFALWFSIRSYQAAAPEAAKGMAEALESAVFGTAATPRLAADPSLTPSSAGGPPSPSASSQAPSSLEWPGAPSSTASAAPTAGPAARVETPRGGGRLGWEGWGRVDSGLSLVSMAAAASEAGDDADSGRDGEAGLLARMCAWPVAPTPRERRTLLSRSRKLMRVLMDIGAGLLAISPAFRRRELQSALERVAGRLPAGPVCLPLGGEEGGILWVVGLCPGEAEVFSTNKRAPYKCVVEASPADAAWGSEVNREMGTRAASEPPPPPPRPPAEACRPPPSAHKPPPVEPPPRLSSAGDSCSGDSGADADDSTDWPSNGGLARGGDCDSGGEAVDGREAPRRPPRALSARGRRADDGDSVSAAGSGRGGGPEQPEGPEGRLRGAEARNGGECGAAGAAAVLDEVFGEAWGVTAARVRRGSRHRELAGWGLAGFLVKTGDDLRQEQLAMQLVGLFHDMFRRAGSRLWLRPYQVVATGPESGLIELVPDAVSLEALRARLVAGDLPGLAEPTLGAYFVRVYGAETSATYKAAQRNFIESMAAYAVVCYLLQVKDRNDGNILLTRDGHVLHIDFGYMLTNSPGDLRFEQAPFKLTSELVDVMGGRDSAAFGYFRELCVQGFLEARRRPNFDRVALLVEMMASGVGADLGIPCVAGQAWPTPEHEKADSSGSKTLSLAVFEKAPGELVGQLRSMYMLGRTDDEVRAVVNELIGQSIDNWYTRQYDNYQNLQKTFNSLLGW